jgi:hypothetical protein
MTASVQVREQTRRRYLKAVGAGTATVLGGCVGDGEDDGSPTSAGNTETSTDDTTDKPSDETTPTEEETTVLSERAWPMFQVDAANTGYHPTTTGPSGDMSEQEKIDIGGDVHSAPTIVDGTIYVGHITTRSSRYRRTTVPNSGASRLKAACVAHPRSSTALSTSGVSTKMCIRSPRSRTDPIRCVISVPRSVTKCIDSNRRSDRW